MRKAVSLFLACALIVGAFSGCGKESAPTYTIDETRFNVIEADGTSKFNIVRPDGGSDSVINAAASLRESIFDLTDVKLNFTTDFEKEGHPEYQRQDYEILVGHTNRDETAEACVALERNRDFSILQSGTRIAIVAANDAYTQDAVDYFVEHYIDDNTNTVSIPAGECYVEKYEYPIETMTINGIDAKDYAVFYGNDDYADEAELIRSFINENYGYSINTSKTVKKSAENKILLECTTAEPFITLSDELGYLENRTYVKDGTIALCSGLFTNHAAFVENFVNSYFSDDAITKNLDIVIEDKSEEAENTGFTVVEDDTDDVVNEILLKAEERKDAIVKSESEYVNVEDATHTYYVSADGSDTADGLTPETAWQSIQKVNGTFLQKGDIVLFRRGDEFRGKINLSDNVTYSAYGDGPKPIINASAQNFADESLWRETDDEGVYVCTRSLDNVGCIVFDYSGVIGNYEETIGHLKICDDYDHVGITLVDDLDFCSNLNSQKLYLRCNEGNPGKVFKSIEIAEAGNVFAGSNPDVTIDNLCVMFGGSHGVGSGTVTNRTVSNCIFCWIGGSILKGYNGGNTTRYGNAIEVYGGCNGYHVCNNWIYQIYDTGITHQYSTNDTVIEQLNIEYNGNLIERCHWSIEYYNRGEVPGSRIENVHVHDNIVLYGCYGWGSVGRESGGALHNSFEIVDDVTNYVVEDNIFALSKGNLVRYNEGGDRKIVFRNNTYVQYYNRALGYMFGKTEMFDGTVFSNIGGVLNEEDPHIVYIMKDPEKVPLEEAVEIADDETSGETEETETTEETAE